MSDLIKFTGEIDRISKSGNGIIELKNGHINLGPLPDEAVGERLKAASISSTLSGPAYCVAEKYISTEYLGWASGKFEPELKKTYTYPKKFTVKIKEIRETGNAFAHDPRCSQDILVVSLPKKVEPSDIVKVKLREARLEHTGPNVAKFVRVIDEVEEYGQVIDEWIEDIKEKLKIDEVRESEPEIRINSDGSQEEIYEFSQTTKQSSLKKSEPTGTAESTSRKNLDSLREQAKNESEETVTESADSTTQTTQQYRRSQSVRDYVMARAGGVCEGCGEPAPFTSKTGDTYLHAHHTQELSEGGSDTIDKVIALCPNCHYRIHHGKDGNEYNRELKQKLSELER